MPNVASRAFTARARAGELAAAKTVSSPAIVPMMSGKPDVSSAIASAFAVPGGVFSTTRFPAIALWTG